MVVCPLPSWWCAPSPRQRVAALSPGMVLAVVANAALVATFACVCLCVHRRTMAAQLRRLEAELEAARRAQRSSSARPGTDRARILGTELSSVDGDDELDVEVASAPARRARPPKLPPSNQAHDMED